MEERQPRKTEQGLVSRGRALAGCVLCLVLGAASALGGVYLAMGQDSLTLLQAEKTIQEVFVGEYDREEHRQETLAAMVTSLGDPWSYYLTPEDYQRVKETRANTYVGIGITVSRELADGLLIQKVAPESPAQEAGLQPGDIIRGVEGKTVTQETMEDCIQAIAGEEGTSVTLEVEGPDGRRRTLEVERRTIQDSSARWELLENGVGLLTIQNFYSGTADQVEEGVEELTGQGAKALVLDVRYNPGGYVTQMIKVLDLLLPEGTIFVSRNAQGEETVYTSDPACVDLPLAVLINGESYSAAEFLAAQLRESAGAVVAGTRTVGKGYSQKLYLLADGSALGLSSGQYSTGGGTSLIGVGVEPDPSVELTDEAKAKLLVGSLPYEEDLQLQAAIRALGLEE